MKKKKAARHMISRPITEDIITAILSFLPPKTLIRLKLVSTDWAKLISSPFFVSIHSKAAPVTALFIIGIRCEQGPPKHLTGLISSDLDHGDHSCDAALEYLLLRRPFNLLASSNGLICFRRRKLPSFAVELLICNPATQRWAFLSNLCPPPTSPRQTIVFSLVLLYDPAKSIHYKIVEIVFTLRPDDNNQSYGRIYFHIFSSQTWSWRISSNHFSLSDLYTRQFYAITGEGAVCTWDKDEDCMIGFDISTDDDTCWKAPLPSIDGEDDWVGKMSESKGQIYFIKGRVDNRIAVWRLEGKVQWVLEGQGSIEALRVRYRLIAPLAYDAAQRTVMMEMISSNCENVRPCVVAYHLPSSRSEVACEGVDCLGVKWCGPYKVFPHSNTLGTFHIEVGGHGGEEAEAGHGFGIDAL